MEYIKGVPLTEYCDAAKLTVRRRLELFIPVCEAVQHAHQKGIIHRDLKPSNIVVALYDGKPVPKVIDFGLAKAMHQPLTERTLYTAHEMVLGTPLYMSPEQAELNNLDIDTRADIYALGVILYELLTGATPLERQRFKLAAWDEILRIIREEEPPKPSTRLSGSTTLPALAAQRQMEPVKLARAVRGELDWIVMKALDKDRNRRYETANGFSLDIQRYLDDEPVQAGPPSTTYRLRKFLRRHRTGVLATAAVLLSVVIALIGQAINIIQRQRAEAEAIAARDAEAAQRREAEEQRDRAIKAEAEAKQQRDEAIRQKRRADNEAAVAKAVNDFLQHDLLAQANPDKQSNRDIMLRTVLDHAAAKVAGRIERQPLVEAAIRLTIGSAYAELGELTRSKTHLEAAHDLRRRELGEEHPDTLAALCELALLYNCQNKYADAEALYIRVLEGRRRVLGDEHPDTLIATFYLARLHIHQGKLAQAEPESIQALLSLRRVLGEEHPKSLESLYNQGQLYMEQGRYAEAEPVFARALELHLRVMGEEHPFTIGTMELLGFVYMSQGRFAQAESILAKALELGRRSLGQEHYQTLESMCCLGLVYRQQGRYKEAEPMVANVLDTARRTLGEEHYETVFALATLALVSRDQQKFAQAESLFSKALAASRRRVGPEHPHTLEILHDLGLLYQERGMYSDAEQMFLRTLDGRRRNLGAESPFVAETYSALGENHLKVCVRRIAS
jgi:non-specific serine/threonine protein kinase/serine/threonine-protein kinase